MPDTQLDLAACANEPIRIPGAIQPHGVLACLDAAGSQLLARSANWSQCVGVADTHEAVQQQLRAWLVGHEATLAELASDTPPQRMARVMAQKRDFDLLAHRSGERLFVEAVPAGPLAERAEPPINRMVQTLVRELQSARDIPALARCAAREIRRLTGFGRSLVYRFDSEGHGRVLAEELEPGYDSYLGLRFPASDIPPQARALYCINRIRLIPDAYYVPAPLVGPGGEAVHGLDLSFAVLRSVSPVHLQYMRNMGTAASMSVSIMVRGQLWGLVSCHHHEPHPLSHDVLLACEHLGQMLSLQVEAKEDNADVADRLELRRTTLELVARLTDSDATLQRLAAEPDAFLRMARATGAAVVLDDQCWTAGDVPPEDTLLRLAAWVAQQDEDVFATDRLAERWPEAHEHQSSASGVLAASISRIHRHVILWFRPEVVQTIDWAGDPRKEASSADGKLHPRRSFSIWKELVRGRCQRWRASEITAAHELRHALIEIVLRRAEELAELAGELGRVNKELEAFSYSVSHDLRAPMRHIAGYIDMVLDSRDEVLSERGRRYLGNVKSAAQFAGLLVDALLEFAHMGRAALRPQSMPLDELVDALVQELATQNRDRRIEWRVEHPLPTVWADPVLLQMALRNLLGNAVKYTRGREPARITVRAVSDDERDGIEVVDNGIGFNMKYVGKLFGVFQRLHTSEEFEGTGIGLANVRRIIERHGGEVRAFGEVGQGARFSFHLPRRGAGPAVAAHGSAPAASLSVH
jgi:light-regulated signal transduction histidine kinase (bacteriophytochrome)